MQTTLEKQSLWTRIKSLSTYQKGIIIYSFVLILIILSCITVVWTFLASYQKGQSETCANAYVNSISEEKWKELITQKIHGSEFRNKRDDVEIAYELYVSGKNFNCRRSPTESKGDNNVYKVSVDGVTICSLDVIKDGKGVFNMPRWAVKNFSISDEFADAINPETTVYIPNGAELCVNGTEVKADSFEVCISPFATELEHEIEKSFLSFTFRAPCGDYRVEAAKDGTTLSKTELKDGIIGFDTADDKLSITVTAPSGSEVYVNNVRLNTGYIAEKNVKYPFLNPLEASLSDIPTSTLYKVEGLYNSPDVKALFNGEELIRAEVDDNNTYMYPFTESGSDYSLCVPVGAEVLVNGVDVTNNEQYVTEENVEYEEVSAYKEELVNPLTCVTYIFKGMFYEPEFEVSDSEGNTCNIVNEQKYSYRCDVAPDISEVDSYKEMAEHFGVTMMEYMFYGRSYLNTGFNNVLSQTRRGSNAYKYVYGSYAGMYWRASHTIEYNKLYADNFIRYADNAFRCDIHYDVVGTRVTADRKEYASGIYRVIYVDNGKGWEIVELSLLNESA